ncbi:FKBP-type peptidyl-prolyl cis-trans isomerase [Mariniphaga sediminis]|jgi:FKBP-type peptidyl-prolyl cis-trans isomerase FklB|uniref:Peptidyl-prolyl cis-trans isomerase n=1 Tax=Mariniphaga sediminis TaxID=1628158 RepID=A0A399CVD9_9BACT|nr:FKBP-type peptidyl-prolyl cis-trans isomerase [Mariniphaga sediminis]RIH63206.1 FKBP-type peptidyl-prolyl cis-trans isomerase [Mariniphaga sediminis]
MAEEKLTGELERFSYALGMSVASNLIKSGVKNINPEAFLKAVNDTYLGEMPQLLPDEANKILESFMGKAEQEAANENLKNGLDFLFQNRSEDGVVELPSGLQYKVLNEGEGDLPTLTDQVKCHYHGSLIDGTVFDSSVERGNPAVFPVNGVIRGWVEALQLMPVGSKWRLFVPPDLGYGEQGAGSVIGPNSTLVFDVELLEIV